MLLDDATIDVALEEILDFHRSAKRRVVSGLRKSSRGREGIDRLSTLGVTIPSDYRRLYFDYEGCSPNPLHPDTLSVFATFEWRDIELVYLTNVLSRERPLFPLTNAILMGRSNRLKVNLCIAPDAGEDGYAIYATKDTISPVWYKAFQNVSSFLRTHLTALRSGAVALDGERVDVDWPRYFDACEEWNGPMEYWSRLRDDSLDWQIDPAILEIGRPGLRPQ